MISFLVLVSEFYILSKRVKQGVEDSAFSNNTLEMKYWSLSRKMEDWRLPIHSSIFLFCHREKRPAKTKTTWDSYLPFIICFLPTMCTDMLLSLLREKSLLVQWQTSDSGPCGVIGMEDDSNNLPHQVLPWCIELILIPCDLVRVKQVQQSCYYLQTV